MRLFALFALTLVFACAESSDPDRPDGSSGVDANTDSGAAADSGNAADSGSGSVDAGSAVDATVNDDAGEADSGVPLVVEVTVTPTTAVLVSIDGSMPTQLF